MSGLDILLFNSNKTAFDSFISNQPEAHFKLAKNFRKFPLNEIPATSINGGGSLFIAPLRSDPQAAMRRCSQFRFRSAAGRLSSATGVSRAFSDNWCLGAKIRVFIASP